MFRILIPALLISLCPALGAQQQGDWNNQIQRRSFFGTQIQEYRLGPGDLIEVSVFGVEKFNQTVRISLSGQVSIPYLGKVQAAGLTGAELEETLAKLMTESKLILAPQVSVFLKEYRSQPVFVLGAVKTPGQYMLTQPLHLIDVIAMAGGLDLGKASEYALLQRRVQKSSGSAASDDPANSSGGNSPVQGKPNDPEPIRIKLKDLLEGGDPSLNLPVQGGDVIQIPEQKPEMIYVIGEVGKPGAYELPRDRRQILLSQAISAAGGPLKTAKYSGGILVRYDAKGNREEMAINWKDILTGRKPDLPVKADDVIFIPGSNMKTIAYGLVTGVSGIAAASVYRPW